MFRSASRLFSPLYSTKGVRTSTAWYFHPATTDFISHVTRGNLVVRKMPIIIGNPGETYVLIDPGVGSALCAASPIASASAASIEDKCELTFFHDSQHFGFGKTPVCGSLCVNGPFSMLGSSNYPRLHVPSQIPRQRDLNTSPATLFLSGKMHEIVLHEIPDGKDLSFQSYR